MHATHAECKGNEDVPGLASKMERDFRSRFVEGLCKPDNEVDWDYIEMMMNSELMGYRIDWLRKLRTTSAGNTTVLRAMVRLDCYLICCWSAL